MAQKKQSAFLNLNFDPNQAPYAPGTPGDYTNFMAPDITSDQINITGNIRQPIGMSTQPAPLAPTPPVPEDMVADNGIPVGTLDNFNYQKELENIKKTPEYMDLMKREASATDLQKSGIAQYEKELNDYQNTPQRPDYSQNNAALDKIFNTNLAPYYEAPPTPEERGAKIMELKNQLLTQKGSMSKENIALIKEQLSSLMAPLKDMAAMQRMGLGQQRQGLREDQQAADAVKAIDNHPLMQKTTQQLAQLDIDRHTIASSPIVTPQILHEISNGIAAALSGGGRVGLGLADMQDLSTSKTKIAAIEQQLTNAPKEGASPAVKKQIMDTLDRLQEAYSQYQSNLAGKLAEGRTYNHNAQARAALKSTVAKYKAAPIPKSAAPSSVPDVNADLDKMSPEELQQWIATHGQ